MSDNRPIPNQDVAPPAGFELIPPYGPFHELNGPIFGRRTVDDAGTKGAVVGMWVQEKHRNAGPIMHGGMLSMLIDTACTWACAGVRASGTGSVTTNLSINMIGAAYPGDWIEAEVSVSRAGRSVIFLKCAVQARGRRIADAIAQFQVVDSAKFNKN